MVRIVDSNQDSLGIQRIASVLLVLVTISSLVVISGCQKEEKAMAPQVPTVEVMAVVQRDVPIYHEWVGALDGSVNAVIRPQITGYLIRQNYREGELVKKGHVLFEIDPRTFQAAVRQAKASVDQAKADLARQKAFSVTAAAELARVKPLAAKNAVSKMDLDDAVGKDLSARASVEAAAAGIAVAEANLDKAQLDLSFTRITSPVEGLAGIAKTQLGNLVGPSMSEELTSVSTVNPIKVYINLSERQYLQAVSSGKKADEIPLQLILADGSIYQHEGRLALADRQVDPTTGTLKLGALFPNKDNRLRPGQYGRIRAMVQTKKGALLIPQRAVTEIQGKYLVAVVGPESKVDVRQVQVGEKIGSEWIIDKGLQAGDQIVAEGTQKVRPEMTVKVKPFSPEAKATPPVPAEKG